MLKQLRLLFMAVSCCAALMTIQAPLQAQSDNGSISGFVRDPSGSVIPNADVTVKDEATSTERRTKTNESGRYVVANIPPGLYTISAAAAGFKTSDLTHNKLDPTANLSVDVSLSVGSATETL